MKNLIVTMPLFAVLAGCSSGGGGGGGNEPATPEPNFVSFSETEDNDTVVLSGTTKTASFMTDPDSGDVEIGAIRSTQDATATVEYRNDLLSRLAIAGSGADFTIDEDAGGSFYDAGGIAVVGESADGDTTIVVVNPDAAGFNYQTYGVWSSGDASGTAGVGSFGARTGDGNMPAGITAIYSGHSAGLVDVDGATYATDSFIAVGTDFNDVTVESYNTELYDIATGAYLGAGPELNFTADGRITGDGFTALINEVAGTGSASGQFYGPNAEEVGGTFEASGAGGVYVGAFGAAR